MNFWSYFIAVLISFLGIFIGFLLIWIAPEERKPGQPYFSILSGIFLFLIAVFLIVYMRDLKSTILAFHLLLAVFVLKGELKRYFVPAMLAYVIFISSKNISLFLINSSLILLYHLSIGSILSNHGKKKQSVITILKYNLSYLILAVCLFIFAGA